MEKDKEYNGLRRQIWHDCRHCAPNAVDEIVDARKLVTKAAQSFKGRKYTRKDFEEIFSKLAQECTEKVPYDWGCGYKESIRCHKNICCLNCADYEVCFANRVICEQVMAQSNVTKLALLGRWRKAHIRKETQ